MPSKSGKSSNATSMVSVKTRNESSSVNAASESADAPPKTMMLRSKIDPSFQIPVGPSVINFCNVLTGVKENTDNSDAVEVDMTPAQLEKFVALHAHFDDSDPLTKKDLEWTNKFFAEMTKEEFNALCWKADYLDSQRFLEASGDYVQYLIENMEVPEVQKYLNIVDDYTAEERKAMEHDPLKFFTGVAIQQDEAEQQQAAGDAADLLQPDSAPADAADPQPGPDPAP